MIIQQAANYRYVNRMIIKMLTISITRLYFYISGQGGFWRTLKKIIVVVLRNGTAGLYSGARAHGQLCHILSSLKRNGHTRVNTFCMGRDKTQARGLCRNTFTKYGHMLRSMYGWYLRSTLHCRDSTYINIDLRIYT